MKVLAIIPTYGHPRYSKRIKMLKNCGFEVTALAFKRDYHAGAPVECNTTIIGHISHGNYIKRIFILLSNIMTFRRSISNSDIVYAFESDMFYISVISGFWLKKTIVLEVGDIRPIQVKNSILGFLIRFFDRFFINRCSLIAVTSPDFYEEYYANILNIEKEYLVIENKVADNSLAIYDQTLPDKTSVISIGYFGLLRCKWSWEVLKLLSKNKRFRVYIAGKVFTETNMEREFSEYPEICYLGEYTQGHIREIYNTVDIVWASYPYEIGDQRSLWARTNRFYEGCFYQTPMITRLGSSDGRMVKAHSIGLCITNQDALMVVQELSAITQSQIKFWKSNLENLDRSVYLQSNQDLLALKEKIEGIQR
jgi:succinoglycan biosynthesis protein ExoL